jgi:hypothetical protein
MAESALSRRYPGTDDHGPRNDCDPFRHLRQPDSAVSTELKCGAKGAAWPSTDARSDKFESERFAKLRVHALRKFRNTLLALVRFPGAPARSS